MQTLVIDINNSSTLNLLYGLSKKLGLKPYIFRHKKNKVITSLEPTDTITAYKYFSPEKQEILRNIIRGMQEMVLVEKGIIQSRPAKQFLDEL